MNYYEAKLDNLLDPTMPRTGLQIYLRPHVTLTFDLLTPKVDLFMPLTRGSPVPVVIKVGLFTFKILSPQVW